MKTLRAFRAAPLGQQLRAAPLGLLLLVTELVLKATNFATARRFLKAIESLWPLRASSLEPAALSSELAAVGRRPPLSRLGVDCVAESIVLEALLRRRGLVPVLRIGVDPTDPSAAHTWVELDDVPINDSSDVHTRLEVFKDSIPEL